MPGPIASPPVPRTIRTTLAWYRHGAADPTTRLAPGAFARATLTPDGPGTVLVRFDATGSWDADAWGPGASWLLARVPAMVGDHDEVPSLPDVAPVVTRAAHRCAGLRLGASGDLYHELLPTIVEQRITGGEAVRQWRRLCLALGEPAPGPVDGLRLPPAPAALARRPAWWFHPFGVEAKRACALSEVARHATRLWDWAEAGPAVAAAKLALVPGVGAWTIGSVLGPALGDPDAVAVGDYHLPNLVAWNLAGEARADDDRMLALLRPFAGQRGRVLRLLELAGARPPAFGPRQRILPMHRW